MRINVVSEYLISKVFVCHAVKIGMRQATCLFHLSTKLGLILHT